MDSRNFINYDEAHSIAALLYALNQTMSPPESQISVAVDVSDSNGDMLGRIEWNSDNRYYVFVPESA